MHADPRVCPRCGVDADLNNRFCGSCGLELATQFELPTRSEWRAKNEPTSAVAPSQPAPSGGLVDPAVLPPPTSPPLRVDPQFGFTGGAPGTFTSSASTPFRETMLGTAATIVASFGILGVVGAFIALLHGIHLHELTGLSVGAGAEVAGELLWLAAFGVAGFAFFGASSSRLRRLRVALPIFALGLFALASTHLIEGGMDASHGALASVVASEFVLGAADLLLAASAIVAVVAMGRALSDPERGGAKMNALMSFAAFVFALGWGGRVVGEVLRILYYNHFGVGGSLTTSFGVFGGAAAFGVASGVIAGIAFLKAGEERRAFGSTLSVARERLLGVSFIVVAFGALTALVGGIIFTSIPGLEGTAKTTTWLVAIDEVGIVVAAICAVVGFFRVGNDHSVREFPAPGASGLPPAGVTSPMR
jgi:hypothetical protein